MNTFNPERERAAQRGDEYRYGAIDTDLAMVPLDDRLRYAPDGVLQFNDVMDTNGCASRAPVNVYKAKYTYLYHNGMHPALKEWLKGPHYIGGKSYSYLVGNGKDTKVVFDETYIEIKSSTDPAGNSLKEPIHAVHKHGLIPECLPLGDGMTWAEYMNPKRITAEHDALASEFMKRFGNNYEQVARKDFPTAVLEDYLVVAGHGWGTEKKGVYQRTDARLNHAFAIANWVINALDNYLPFIKTLVKDYKLFDWGYSLSITRQTPYPPAEKPDFLTVVFNWAAKIIGWQNAGKPGPMPAVPKELAPTAPVTAPVTAPQPPQENKRQAVLEEAHLWIGKDVSPSDIADDELACAESVCNVLKYVYPDFPVLISTARLYEHLRKDKRFKATLDFQPGNIIISPTGTGVGHGHAGICAEDERIMSNTSATGKWENNYGLANWIAYFRHKKAMRVYYFEPI